jgi:hypothetical protein
MVFGVTFLGLLVTFAAFPSFSTSLFDVLVAGARTIFSFLPGIFFISKNIR